MIEVNAYCDNFECCPADNWACKSLHSLFSCIEPFHYTYKVLDPTVNQGQMVSDFDSQFEKAVLSKGAVVSTFAVPPEIRQQLDFAFDYEGKRVAVEVEKTNREKILRDILKAHMYLHAGADYALIVLAKNYPHSCGIWKLYECGVQQFEQCLTYGFGTKEKLDRILLLGYEQFDAETNKPLDTQWRKRVRQMCK